MVVGIDPALTKDIRRHFVTVDGRQVHYARAGSGPCVVLCHGSPNSGLSQFGLINALKDRFTVIAPDTPGNGNSDPLDIDNPTIPDYARALEKLLDALEIDKCAVYGFHTGADIAVTIAVQSHERITQVVANGLPFFTQDERDLMLEKYLPPFEPQWDGSHLCWLWPRLTEQQVFFPWHEQDAEHRMLRGITPPDSFHMQTLEFLRAGDAYRKPYRAAFLQNSKKLFPDLTVPTTLCAFNDDPLSEHLDRVGTTPDIIRINKIDKSLATMAQELNGLFDVHGGGEPSAAPRPDPFSGDRFHQDFVEAGGGQVYFLKREGSGRPIVALHDPASSSRLFDAYMLGPNGDRLLYAIDLPGSGESDNTFSDGVPTIEGYAEKLGEILDALGETQVDIVGYYSGGYVGAELAIGRRDLVKNLAFIGVEQYGADEQQDRLAHYTPDISPRWDGTHLITAWRMMRAQGLFNPWYKTTKEAAMADPYVDADMLHRRVVDLMKCGNTYQHAYRAYFTYATLDRLPLVPCSKWVCKLSWDPRQEGGVEIAKVIDAPTVDISPDMSEWPSFFADLFTD